jgi:hypothetical protein
MRDGRLRPRFWIEAGLATISGILLVVTLVWRDWAEILFGFEPDEGNGSFEIAVTVAAIAATVAFVLAAKREWRRARLSQAP